MRLSILMPTHERPETLRHAIASVCRQDFPDWELLVCGDGCGAATDALMQEWVARDDRIRWFPLPKAPGFGYANRNRVLAEARGSLVAFAAHDNLVFADHWAALVEMFDDPAVMMAVSGSIWVDGAGRMIPTVFNLLDVSVRNLFITGADNRIPANAVVYRRTIHESVGMWNEELLRCGDLDLWGRVLRHHGLAALRYRPEVSFLHFRASWKDAAGVADPHGGPLWNVLFSEPGRLPDCLTLPVPADALPQDVFHARMDAFDGRAWELETRRACRLALESYAWTAEQECAWMDQKIRKLRAKVAKLKARLDGTRPIPGA